MKPAACTVALARIGAGTWQGALPTVETPEDWATIIELANEHRVAPLVWQALTSAPAGRVPQGTLDALDASIHWSRGASMLCEHALGSLLALTKSQEIDVLVLKGASLAHTLYPLPELRPYHDLDILCRQEDQPKLYDAMRAAGYTYEKEDEPPAMEGRSPRVATYVDPSGALEVEIHSDVLQFGLVERHHEDLWRDAATVTCGSFEMRVLSPAHQLLHLAAHAHRHFYSRLLWLIDLDLLIRRHLDTPIWDEVMAVARDEGIGAIVRHALACTHELLDTPLPSLPMPSLEERALGACYRALWPRASLRRLDRKERRRLLYFRPEMGDPREVFYGLVLLGRRREKLAILGRHARRGSASPSAR